MILKKTIQLEKIIKKNASGATRIMIFYKTFLQKSKNLNKEESVGRAWDVTIHIVVVDRMTFHFGKSDNRSI